jgi:hypothetical protein
MLQLSLHHLSEGKPSLPKEHKPSLWNRCLGFGRFQKKGVEIGTD